MENLTLSQPPHLTNRDSTSKIMWTVCLSLIPVCLASIYFFKVRALHIIAVSIISCLVAEALYQIILRKPVTIVDGSAFVTGLLFALILPPYLPFGFVILGSFVSIILGKQIFGGLGQNIFNPALIGRAFLLICFPKPMTTWHEPFSLDAVTKATPLTLAKFQHASTNIKSLFLGNIPGSIGETSALAILLGAVILVARKCIDWRVSVGYLGSVFVLAQILHMFWPDLYMSGLFHILAGGLMLGAVYMATDPVTSPVTKKGKWVFGIGCGIILVAIRFFAGMPEGVTFSILIMNALVPMINMLTKPKRFGV